MENHVFAAVLFSLFSTLAASAGDAFFWAVVNCDRVKVGTVLASDPTRLEDRDSRGNTPLILAAENGCADLISDLMRLGANKNAVNGVGASAILAATLSANLWEQKRLMVVKELIFYGADLNTVLNDNANEYFGASAAVLAKVNNYDSIFDALRLAGADLLSAQPFLGACGFPTAEYLIHLKAMGFTTSQAACLSRLRTITKTRLDQSVDESDANIRYYKSTIKYLRWLDRVRGSDSSSEIKDMRQSIRMNVAAKKAAVTDAEKRNAVGRGVINAVIIP